MDWIVGKARGEIPWFGLIKLAIYGNRDTYHETSDPTTRSNWGILNSLAPSDIWICLFVSIAVLITIPVGVDFLRDRLRKHRGDAGKKPPS
jgi:hypothetical protein